MRFLWLSEVWTDNSALPSNLTSAELPGIFASRSARYYFLQILNDSIDRRPQVRNIEGVAGGEV